MSYNLTNLSQSNNFLDYTVASNEITGGLLINVVLVVLAIILYTRLISNNDGVTAALGTGSIMFALSGILFVVGLVSASYPLVFLVITLLALAKKITE